MSASLVTQRWDVRPWGTEEKEKEILTKIELESHSLCRIPTVLPWRTAILPRACHVPDPLSPPLLVWWPPDRGVPCTCVKMRGSLAGWLRLLAGRPERAPLRVLVGTFEQLPKLKLAII